MASLDEAAILELGRTPIPGAAPAGIDAGDDLAYIEVTRIIDELDRTDIRDENGNPPPPPDWFKVEQGCIGILRNKSKALDIVFVLGHALFQRYRYAGLATTLSLFTEMVTNFWDTMYPERPRRRKALVEGYCERFGDGRESPEDKTKWFRAVPPKSDDFDAIDQALQRLEALRAALSAKLADDPPDVSAFARRLKELAGQRPKPAQPAAAETPAADAGGGGGGGGGATFSAGEIKDASGAINAITSAATFLRQANPGDPLAYALPRAVKWANVSLPSADRDKLEPTEDMADLVDRLTFQFDSGKWENLLNSAEGAFRAGDPLWLDLQRYVCAAMTNLGPSYDKARQVVISATGGLVRRLGSGLFDLKFKPFGKFSSGLPLCSGETKLWIESEVATAGGGGGSKGGSAAGNGKLDEASEGARKLAGSGKLKEAIELLQEGLATCVQRRDRFVWRLRLAQLFCDAQKLQLAAPLAEECQDEVERYQIGEWERSLAIEVAQTLYRCRKGLLSADKEPAADAKQRTRESFARLCQLDPLAALAAEPPNN